MKWSNDDKEKSRNLKGLFSNPSTRPVLFLTGGLLVGVLGLGYFGMGDAADEDVKSSASVSKAPSVTHLPGANTSSAHTALQQEANRRALEEAQRRGQTAIPVITGNATVNEPLTLPSTPTQQQPTTMVPTVTLPPPPSGQIPVQVQQQPVVVQQQPAAPAEQRQASDAINKQIQGYLALWGPSAKQFQEYVYVQQRSKQGPEGSEEQSGAPVGAVQNLQALQSQNNASSNSTQTEQANKIRFARAGSTAQGMLLTPLNSDAPGPVVGQITTGPLAGARLMGTMSVGKDSILANFTTISKPGWPDSYSVRAVGMTQDWRTGLATDVNKHYMQKYLGLLAGTFAEGYGSAMQQQGQIAYINDNGTIVTERDELNAGQIQKSAQGKVYETLGRDWRRASNREATIKVEGKDGSPYAIQILFLENF